MAQAALGQVPDVQAGNQRDCQQQQAPRLPFRQRQQRNGCREEQIGRGMLVAMLTPARSGPRGRSSESTALVAVIILGPLDEIAQESWQRRSAGVNIT